MLRALLCPPSGARDNNVDYHIGYSLQPGHYSSLPATNLQPTANQERETNNVVNNIIVASS